VARREMTDEGMPIIKGVLSNITEIRQSEKVLRMQARRAQGLLELFQLKDTSDDVLIDSALVSLAEITESSLAFVGLIDDDEAVMQAHHLSNPAMDACAVSDRSTDFNIGGAGLWAEAIRNRAPVVCNNYAPSVPGSQGLPDGHVPLSRFMAIPLIRNDRTVLLAGLANKKDPYEEHDVAEVSVFLEGLWGRLTAAREQRERVQLEEQLRASQKMEAIGLLAGGVAHDFNNLLSVILSYAGFVLDDLPASDPSRADVTEIKNAAERAAALTRQLLAFGRRQVVEPTVLDLSEVVGSMDKMLRRLIGEDIELVVRPVEGLGRVFADPGQIEQIVMNLVVNARDAMTKGGNLTIEMKDVVLDGTEEEQRLEIKSGPYVMLAISDSGCGMDRETRDRIFEPFFTTKEHGKGTGLGLSTVFGIVKQNNGGIWVYSEPGHGTTFKIFLPLEDAPASRLQPKMKPTSLRGNERLLVVEDEESVRKITARILRDAGYEVLTAASGDEALSVARKQDGEIDLLLTDVVMPRMSGSEVAARMRKIRPSLKVLFMSGYTDDAIVRHGVRDESLRLISKPFAAVDLLAKVREQLDE
jgi:signal transduction histidine kinase/ActR/RegA family two-component response regulator